MSASVESMVDGQGRVDDAGGGGLSARDIGRRRPDSDEWLIRGLNLTVEPGERVALIGPTGAGKTVFLRAIATLDPIQEGAVRWSDRLVTGDFAPVYRSHAVYLHQRAAFDDASVERILRHPFTMRVHRGRAYDRARVIELLQGVGRGESFLEQSSRDLSGGESQIVALVRAIQLDPDLLFLDEPTASLDRATTRAVESLIERWREERRGRGSLVLVSHDLDQTRRVATRRLILTSTGLHPET